ncbi:MAG: hypothetical protein U0768_06275 [Anaerolineae bacterium]
MTDTPIVGPYRILDASSDVPLPWYMIPFDPQGVCTAPQTRAMLIGAAQDGGYTDVFLFSHGWNNTWNVATANYAGFMTGYADMVRARGLTYPRPFHPLLVGIYWPSIEFIRADEEPPAARDIEAVGEPQPEPDLAVAVEYPDAHYVTADVSPADRARFVELASRSRLTQSETLEMAQMLLPVYQQSAALEDMPPVAATISAQDLVDLWSRTLPPDSAGGAETDAPTDPLDPTRGIIANVLSFDPRDILRVVTFLKMKGRAGVVGADGVGPLLRDLLAANSTARVHLLGHSYGCQVVLAALCAQPLDRQVNSALLLQPAVSCLCFADNVLNTGKPGGFRAALERVEQPILVTYSRRDLPLHDFYHLAVRRLGDVGEVGEDRGLETPPDPHAALGGYGPVGCADECADMEMPAPGDGYNLPTGARVIGLNGAQYISGHSDISNAATWWALYSQVASQ